MKFPKAKAIKCLLQLKPDFITSIAKICRDKKLIANEAFLQFGDAWIFR